MAWRRLLTQVANQQSKHPYLIDLRGRSVHKGASGGANLKVPHLEVPAPPHEIDMSTRHELLEVPAPPHEIDMSTRHELWMAEHGRTYKDESEKEARFKIFKQNVEYIESFNKRGDHMFKLGVNPFADLTHQEFRSTYYGHRSNRNAVASKDSGTAVKDEVTGVSKQQVEDGIGIGSGDYLFRFYKEGIFTGFMRGVKG